MTHNLVYNTKKKNKEYYDGKGIIDWIVPTATSAMNLIKDNSNTIKDIATTAGSIGNAIKNINDARKSSDELTKAREEKNQSVLKTMEIMDQIKAKKKTNIPNSKTDLKTDSELERFLNQVKTGKGLKRM